LPPVAGRFVVGLAVDSSSATTTASTDAGFGSAFFTTGFFATVFLGRPGMSSARKLVMILDILFSFS
jgi:hypothetical protein